MSVTKRLIAGIENQHLRTTIVELMAQLNEFSESEQVLISDAAASIESLDASLSVEIKRVAQLMQEAGVEVKWSGPAYPKRALHILKLKVATSQVSQAAAVLNANGFGCDPRSQDELKIQFAKFFNAVSFWPTDGSHFRVQLEWDHSFWTGSRIGRRLCPTLNDLTRVSLPKFLWPAYPLVRLSSRILGKRKNRQDQPTELGPFLGTLPCLITPLLKFGGVNSSDQLIDLGCGDGRVLFAAAKEFGCQCRGYEVDSELVQEMQETLRYKHAELPVEIVQGDAMSADLSTASIVFIFLPVSSIQRILPELLKRIKPGARIVVHEQEKLHNELQPNESIPLIASGGVTVAHKWIAGKK